MNQRENGVLWDAPEPNSFGLIPKQHSTLMSFLNRAETHNVDCKDNTNMSVPSQSGLLPSLVFPYSKPNIQTQTNPHNIPSPNIAQPSPHTPSLPTGRDPLPEDPPLTLEPLPSSSATEPISPNSSSPSTIQNPPFPPLHNQHLNHLKLIILLHQAKQPLILPNPISSLMSIDPNQPNPYPSDEVSATTTPQHAFLTTYAIPLSLIQALLPQATVIQSLMLCLSLPSLVSIVDSCNPFTRTVSHVH
ncbi:hypothetical protein PIB30_018306 [Stylosanthes scabra]|uniref:Uncharacterized protein n=1 Tax=Stylosanthes scabra TaxID=79078 RepID=A0ABU6Z6V4_9FABA|nr:hypothetical protein [Stylosanthes scabra]